MAQRCPRKHKTANIFYKFVEVSKYFYFENKLRMMMKNRTKNYELLTTFKSLLFTPYFALGFSALSETYLLALEILYALYSISSMIFSSI